jgi:hypothetical protein
MLPITPPALLLGAPDAPDTWHFKAEFLPPLVAAVPGIMQSQDPATGRFGSGVWIVTDQNVLLPLATAWSLEAPGNPHFHNAVLLQMIMAGGDALIDDQDADGMWVFRKKDGSTWGNIYMPWTYSRWLRAYGLIRDAMPAERRARWEQALTLGYAGIARTALNRIHNIPAHHAAALYLAGQLLARPGWCRQAAEFLGRVAGEQDEGGFWSEHMGPVVSYNLVYVDALGSYHALSGDRGVLPALERSARFHANFTYPDGSKVETVDERNPYHEGVTMPNVGFSFSPEGRGYVRRQWERLRAAGQALSADLAASFLLYGEEGPAAAAPGGKAFHHFVLGQNDAVVQREGPWFACFSGYACPVPENRWIQDRQNFVSLFHDRAGLIVGGGNTKLQPRWSTFTLGDTRLLAHRAGDESPTFTPPAGLLHVPAAAALDADSLALSLRYGDTSCRVSVHLLEPQQARLCYVVEGALDGPAAAHVTLLPHLGEAWETDSGQRGTLGNASFEFTQGQAGAWFAHHGWRVALPPDATVTWPVLPHNPYRKDGRAETAEARIVITLPFERDVTRQEITVEVRGEGG